MRRSQKEGKGQDTCQILKEHFTINNKNVTTASF